jgi:hypothetical protein
MRTQGYPGHTVGAVHARSCGMHRTLRPEAVLWRLGVRGGLPIAYILFLKRAAKRQQKPLREYMKLTACFFRAIESRPSIGRIRLLVLSWCSGLPIWPTRVNNQYSIPASWQHMLSTCEQVVRPVLLFQSRNDAKQEWCMLTLTLLSEAFFVKYHLATRCKYQISAWISLPESTFQPPRGYTASAD